MQPSRTECQESTWTLHKVTCPFRKHRCVTTCFGRPTGLQIGKSQLYRHFHIASLWGEGLTYQW